MFLFYQLIVLSFDVTFELVIAKFILSDVIHCLEVYLDNLKSYNVL